MKVRETHACYGHRLMMHSFCSERSFSRSPRRRTHTLSSLHPRPRHARACCLRPVGPSLRIRGCFLSTFARQPPTCSVPPFPSPQLLRLSSRSPLEHLFLGVYCTRPLRVPITASACHCHRFFPDHDGWIPHVPPCQPGSRQRTVTALVPQVPPPPNPLVPMAARIW